MGNIYQCIRDLRGEKAKTLQNGTANLPVSNVGQHLKDCRYDDTEIVLNKNHILPDSKENK